MPETKAVAKGSAVKVEYEGRFEDGTIFDASEKHGKPLEFEAGSGQVIKGFDAAVMGMKKGDEKEITIQPAEAYGNHNPELVKEIPRDKLPPSPEPKKGMLLALGLPNGQQMPAKIVTVTRDHVSIDLNHPLAGKTLIFKIKLVDFS